MLKITNDPIKAILTAFDNLYPEKEADIQFNPEIEECGFITFPDDGGKPLIDISTNIPFEAIIETLAHELSHLVMGVTDDEHGDEWDSIFARLQEEYCKVSEEMIENYKEN